MDVNQEVSSVNAELVYPEIREIYSKLLDQINMCHNAMTIYIDDLSEMKLQISDIEVKLKKQFINLESIYHKYCEMEVIGKTNHKNNLKETPKNEYGSDEEIIVV